MQSSFKQGILPTRKESAFGLVFRGLLRDRLALIGMILFVGMVVVGIFAPYLAPYDPLALVLPDRFLTPCTQHLFGTDEFGRDILSRVIAASRISVLGSIAAVMMATLVGIPWGLIAGFIGGSIDSVLMRIVDFLLATPTILLAMVILAVLGPSALNAFIAIAVANFPLFARLARSSTLAEKEKDYVLAGRSIGVSNSRLLFRGILPNCIAPILVQFSVSIASAVLLESTLSFLGLGTQPPDPSWGYMLSSGRAYLRESPWYGIFPGVAITVFVLAQTFLADGLLASLRGSRR